MTVGIPSLVRRRTARAAGVVVIVLAGLLVPGPLLASAQASATPATSAVPNLLVNGSFEQPKLADGNYRFFKAIPGWSVDPRTPPIELQRGTVGPAEHGHQYIETDSVAPAQLHQSFTVPPGDQTSCTLLVSYAPRPSVVDNHTAVVVADASAPLTTLDLVADGASDSEPVWRVASATFPPGTDHALTVTISDLSARDGLGMLVDGVAVTCG